MNIKKYKSLLLVALTAGLLSCNNETVVETTVESANTPFEISVSGAMTEKFSSSDFKFSTPIAGKLSSILPFYPAPEGSEKRFIIRLDAISDTVYDSEKTRISLILEIDTVDFKTGNIISIKKDVTSKSFRGGFYREKDLSNNTGYKYQLDGFILYSGEVRITGFYPGNPGFISGGIVAKAVRSSGFKSEGTGQEQNVTDYSNNLEEITIQSEFNIPALTVDKKNW